MTGHISPLFTPFTTRGLTFRNRIIVSPMCQYAAVDGAATDWHFDHYARWALGGVGGALVESTGVLPQGRITPGCLGIWSDDHVEGLARITRSYHREGAAIGIQLGHAGRKGSSHTPWDGGRGLDADDPRGWTCDAPSALSYDGERPAPHEMTAQDIATLVEAFAQGARRAVAAGFDFIEIHGAHGYLIHSFVSPLSNQRSDAYGGSAENRMRLPVEIATAVRAAIPEEMPLFYRASCVDRVDGGIEIADTMALAGRLKAAGVDVLDCSSGGIALRTNPLSPQEGPDFQTAFAAQLRAGAGIATMAVGGITDPHQAEAVVAGGSADLVALGKEMLADSNFAHRAADALGIDKPDFVLPQRYAFYLQFRRK